MYEMQEISCENRIGNIWNDEAPSYETRYYCNCCSRRVHDDEFKVFLFPKLNFCTNECRGEFCKELDQTNDLEGDLTEEDYKIMMSYINNI